MACRPGTPTSGTSSDDQAFGGAGVGRRGGAPPIWVTRRHHGERGLADERLDWLREIVPHFRRDALEGKAEGAGELVVKGRVARLWVFLLHVGSSSSLRLCSRS